MPYFKGYEKCNLIVERGIEEDTCYSFVRMNAMIETDGSKSITF